MAYTDNIKTLINREDIELEDLFMKRFDIPAKESFEIRTDNGKLTAASVARLEAAHGKRTEETEGKDILINAPLAVYSLLDEETQTLVSAELYIPSLQIPFYDPTVEVYCTDTEGKRERTYRETYIGSLTADGIYSALKKMVLYQTVNEITSDRLTVIETTTHCARFKLNHKGISRLEPFISDEASEWIELTAEKYAIGIGHLKEPYIAFDIAVCNNTDGERRNDKTIDFVFSTFEDNALRKYASQYLHIEENKTKENSDG